MTSIYMQTEDRIQQAIEVIQTRPNAMRTRIARSKLDQLHPHPRSLCYRITTGMENSYIQKANTRSRRSINGYARARTRGFNEA